MDYHKTFEDYFAAKLRLFRAQELARRTPVLNTDG